jgi:carbon monoxide dehydrogenase subunit G
MDEATHTVHVKAEGAETRGRGGASATMTAQLQPSAKGTSVVMTTDLAVSGVVAQFGRTGIMQEVAQRMAQRFASCVDQELKAATPAV